MAVAWVSSVGQEFAAATSYTVSAVTVSGTNTYGLVIVALRTNTGTITGVTFNGVSMTNLGSVNNNPGSETIWMWGLKNPGTGDVVISGDTSLAAEVIVSIYQGVHQTTSTGTVVTATGNSTAPSVDATSASGEIVVDGVGNRGGLTETVGAGQTQRKRSPATGDGISMVLLSSDEPGAATVTMSWSYSIADQWPIIAVPLKAAAAAGGSSLLGLMGLGMN